jgi:ABC-type nickel/cobalt efflux system permease component RcnA
MREVLATAVQTIGYVLVTSAALWLIWQHAPSP